MTDDSPESPNPDTEALLFAGMQRADPQACARLVQLFAPRMLGVAGRLLNDPIAAEDCVQEAFLNAFCNIDQFEKRSSFGTWLHRITVDTALLKLRSNTQESEGSIDDLLPNFDQQGCRIEPVCQARQPFQELIQQKDIQERVMSKVRELPEKYRNVFILCDIEEMGTSDVSELLGISEGEVKKRLHRSRAALKTLLEPVWEWRPK